MGESTSLDTAANHGTPLLLHSKLLGHDLKSGESWQEMFLTQPPVQHVTVEVGNKTPDLASNMEMLLSLLFSERSFKSGSLSKKISVENGVRLKDVVTAVQSLRCYPGEVERHAIFMHGAIAVTTADNEMVVERTKQWRRSLSLDTDGPHAQA